MEVRVLLVEDNPDHVELIQSALALADGLNVSLTVVGTMTEGLKLANAECADLALFDLSLPDSSLEASAKVLVNTTFNIPIVALTSLNNVALSKTLLNGGLQDYIPKDEMSPQLIGRTCLYAIERWRGSEAMKKHNDAMKTFCASLSHDFNGHIGRIIGLSGLIEREFKERIEFSQDENTWFDYLHKCAHAAQQLVKDLNSFLEVEYANSKLKNVAVKPIVLNTIDSLKLSASKEFDVEFIGEEASVLGDETLIKLALLNLFSNAIKFCETRPSLTVSSRIEGDNVIIAVKDNGIGFDAEKSDMAFAPFQRLSSSSEYEGTGLGLSIVKRCMEHCGGAVSVSSKVGEGSEFYLKFLKSTGQ